MSDLINDLHTVRRFLKSQDYEASAEVVARAIAAIGTAGLGAPPQDGSRFLAVVDGDWRLVAYGKTSHLPITGWILVDQGAEEADLCEFTEWRLLPPLPQHEDA